MPAATQMILAGMPEPMDLRRTAQDGQNVITVGDRVLACYHDGDLASRNVAVVMLRELGFSGERVAQVVGLTPVHVSNLRGRARREGLAGLVRVRGRRPALTAAQVARARALRAEGVSDVQIARRLGVSDKTVARVVRGVEAGAPAGEQTALALDVETTAQPEPDTDDTEPVTGPDTGSEPGVAQPDAPVEAVVADGEPQTVAGGDAVVAGADVAAASGPGQVGGGSARIGTGEFGSRYAGAMLLHAFTDRVHAEQVFAQAATTDAGGVRFDDLAVLTATSMVFGLGFASMEQAKHPDRAQVGPLAGITVLPELRTLRPRLAGIADGADPLGLQRAFAQAMLAADPCTSGVYFIDEHFMPYAGALPVGKGYNTKRRRGEPGRVDTMIADAAGRAVCFTTGEPSGLGASLPATLAELRQVTGDHAKIMLAFDRGGAYASVFTTCRQAGVDWITYRRGTLTKTSHLPQLTTVTRGGKPVAVAYTDQTVTITDYGQCRQLTLFEHGTPVLQILTSDTTACPAALICFLRARWRIENLFKYLDFYGIDYLADYTATITTNTRPVDNPARTQARNQLKTLQQQREQLRTAIGAAHTTRALTVAAINTISTKAQTKIHKLDREINKLTQDLKTIPAKLPANLINPDAQHAIHRATRRTLQMVLRLLAHNAEHWLANQLNTYLQDPNEYRATTRNLLHLAGTITYTPTTIHVQLHPPATPRLARALNLLLQQLNTTPPHLPGDPRPITYTLTT